MNAPNIIALVYRAKSGCRQYPFETVEALAYFSTRHPYKNEHLKVIPIINGKLGTPFIAHASNAAARLQQEISEAPADKTDIRRTINEHSRLAILDDYDRTDALGHLELIGAFK